MTFGKIATDVRKNIGFVCSKNAQYVVRRSPPHWIPLRVIGVYVATLVMETKVGTANVITESAMITVK
jgi:hypothetical protein